VDVTQDLVVNTGLRHHQRHAGAIVEGGEVIESPATAFYAPRPKK
jgi:hypothetical protein